MMILSIISLGVIAVLGYVYFINKDNGGDKTESAKYLDQTANITFEYPGSYLVVEDIVSKVSDGVYVKSIQFSTDKDKIDLLPMQITVFAKEDDETKFKAKIDEVERYYQENGKEVSRISIKNVEVPLYHAEIKNEKSYIIGVFYKTNDLLFLIERYHTGSKADDLADSLANQIIASIDY
jgi:hypothetical protein